MWPVVALIVKCDYNYHLNANTKSLVILPDRWIDKHKTK